jgi:hypothetical protein
MVIGHRLASRAPSSAINSRYNAQLLRRAIGHHHTCDIYLASVTNHTILSAVATE